MTRSLPSFSATATGARWRNGCGVPMVGTPGASVTLFTGCGTDTQTERFWCKSGSAVWNNTGDVVSLFDASGALIAERAG